MQGSPNEFTGDSDTVVQINTLHGSINLAATAHAMPRPRQLPLPAGGFVNRAETQDALDRLLAAESGTGVVSAVAGAPGVGKTALVVHWAHRVRDRFRDGDLYIDLGGYGPSNPLSAGQALDGFLRALNVPKEAIPASVEERSALFRSLTNERRMLVILDNAADTATVRPLLPASSGCFVLVTSRSTLSGLVAREGAARVTLDVLAPSDAVELLGLAVGSARVAAEPDAAARVAELCGRLPLALRVVAERAVNRPGLLLSDLVFELEEEQHRLDSLASGEDELSDVRAAFSWSYHALSPETRRAFRLLGLHPGREFSTEAAMAILDSADHHASRRLLDGLTTTHLLERTSGNRYRLHDLLRTYAKERLGDETSPQDQARATRRVLSWYLLATDAGRRAILPYSHEVPLVPKGRLPLPEFPDAETAMSWFEVERLNVLSALTRAMETGQYDIAWKLPVAADGFFELHSFWAEWEEIHRVGTEAARILGDRLGEASNLFALGDADWRGGRTDSAIANYESAISYARESGDAWLTGFSLRGLGLIREATGNFPEAERHFRAALDVFRAGRVLRGEGMALLSLGEHEAVQGRFHEAVAFGAEAVRIFTDLGDDWSVAWGALPLARALVALGRHDEALEPLARAVRTFDRFKDGRSQAMALAVLGDVRHALGDAPAARAHWSRAAELYEHLGEQTLSNALNTKAADTA
ncbi:tetratricopeptide repeat protein [Actinocorallia sp. API 0066]|uniref:ATP-binding protein n=1 Tax=Actinocorallia sp. API 0066 TaxID=2896846 RepID=UPI001E55EEE4|nr:tetratricopeptide repeat protein [Actinocorallia sp. API 0066]MCD0453131.1 tetratricopeptide repeat protein [Actinocorallia sp. API 0066]